ncbi:MAG: replication protein [Paenibacillus macerans]|nr:replication protein [Paenibacillus macerans]
MANPQLEDGYTRVANQILEQIYQHPKINGTQFRIILAIWRYTYGFKRKHHELSVSFLADATGILVRQVERELNALIARNIISVISEASGKRSRILGFNKNFDEWEAVDPSKKTVQLELFTPVGLDGSDPSKKTVRDASSTVGLDGQERKYLKKGLKKGDIDMGSPEKLKFHDTVYLTLDQYEKLCADFGKERVDNTIEALDEWQTNKKKSQHKKDHNKTLRVWIKRDMEKTKSSFKPKAQQRQEELDILNRFYEEGAEREANGSGEIPVNDQNRLSLL